MAAPTRLAGVLFDFNGVLVDDEHLHFEGFNAVLAPLGIALTQRDYDDVYLGFDDRGVFEAALRAHGRAPDAEQVRGLIGCSTAPRRSCVRRLRGRPW
jgi:beta-phosphoglucomutase-like phosphatase (HAD superfamily)